MMKKYLSLFILLFIAKAYSQTYVPLLQDGNKWYEYNEFYPDGFGEIALTAIFINGEESRNGVVYKKLFSNLYSKCIDRYAYPSGCYATGNADAFYKLLRENVSERKVYFFDEATNAEVLLYDFSRHIGELLPLNFPFRANNSNYNQNENAPITKIVKDGKVFGKNVPNTFLTKDVINNYEFHDKIYEGIGSNLGLLYIPGRPIFEGGNILLCFETLSSGKSCDPAFLASNEIFTPGKSVLVYSKSTNSLRLTGKSSVQFQLQLYDFAGKLVVIKNIVSNQDFTLNNADLHGVFLYKLTSTSESSTGKISIQ